MGGIKTENVTNRVVLLGDNQFESGTITLDADAVLVAGAVLKREAGGDFAIAAVDDEFIAVNPFEIKNESGAEKVFGFRAIVGGRVRADMLRIGEDTTGSEEHDRLRKVGILPVKVTDLSQTDNQ